MPSYTGIIINHRSNPSGQTHTQYHFKAEEQNCTSITFSTILRDRFSQIMSAMGSSGGTSSSLRNFHSSIRNLQMKNCSNHKAMENATVIWKQVQKIIRTINFGEQSIDIYE